MDKDGDGKIDQWGIRVDPGIYRWPILVHQAGGLLFDRLVEPVKSTFMSPAVRVGLEFFVSLYLEGAAVPLSERSHDLLTRGRVGFSLCDGANSMLGYPESYEWDVAQLPQRPVHNGTSLIMNGYQMSSATAHPDAAWNWIKHLVSREAVRKFMRLTGRTPSLISLLPESLTVFPSGSQNLQAINDAVLNPHSQPVYLTPIYAQLHGTINNNSLVPLVRGEMSVQAALEQLDRAATALLADIQ